MSDIPSFYSCGNEFGEDPCVFARENRKIPAEEAIPNMDGSGGLKCPGKTLSGKDCGCELHPLPPSSRPPWKIILPVAVGIFAVTLVIWFFTKTPDSPDDAKSPDITSDPPVNVTPPPESRDPWWVYQQLETSSKILRTEP
ncbi:MAG: hypothetical protein Q3M30_13130 [Candidatus Electrothrix sp. Rat3]|nr:hypothetical protein [Candidatus Electrothrix rattekaaiensis]